MAKIAIVGLGLIGTSLGLALRKSNPDDIEIVGCDVDRKAAVRCMKMKAVHKTEPHLPTAVSGVDMVIIATPVLAIRDVLEEISPHLAENTIVTDTGSTKVMVLEWAAQYLPPTIAFVGGHPMAGKIDSGPDVAEADLFVGAVYCILAPTDSKPEAIQAVLGLVNAIGAVPYFVGAEEHDSYVAAVSHLPIAISTALVTSTARSPSWREMARVAAGGYQDITRLAQGDPIMNRDILLTNQEPVAYWIDELIKELYSLRTMLKEKPVDLQQRLQDLFLHAWENRTDWVIGEAQREQQSVGEMPTAGAELARTLAGEWVMRKFEMGKPGEDYRIRQERRSKLKQKKKGWFKR